MRLANDEGDDSGSGSVLFLMCLKNSLSNTHLAPKVYSMSRCVAARCS